MVRAYVFGLIFGLEKFLFFFTSLSLMPESMILRSKFVIISWEMIGT